MNNRFESKNENGGSMGQTKVKETTRHEKGENKICVGSGGFRNELIPDVYKIRTIREKEKSGIWARGLSYGHTINDHFPRAINKRQS